MRTVSIAFKRLTLLAVIHYLILSTSAGTTSPWPNTRTIDSSQQMCSTRQTLKQHAGSTHIKPSIEKNNIALLLVLGFGGFSLIVAMGYKALRKFVYHDSHSLDTIFDAGGRVSLSLTAVTVTSQLIWPSGLLTTGIFTVKAGLGGAQLHVIGVVIDVLLFPALSLYLKTRAPGAKTFPQIAYARFGKVTHIIFCILALLINIIVSTSVMLAGKSSIEVLAKESNNEFIFLIMSVLFGSYCLVGGLGTTFYISYFNTALTFIAISVFMVYTNFIPPSSIKDISSLEAMYNSTVCISGPSGNYDSSYMTFRSTSGAVFGTLLMFQATSISFCDQANWQSRIAAKPSQGVVGFFFAAYIWFFLPTIFGLTSALPYFVMSAKNGTHLLSEAEIDNGYVTPFVMNELMGDTGGYLLLTILTMALMSTGSGEVMAISSIVVYDIYKTYINPFRKGLKPTSCILCGKEKQILEHSEEQGDFCHCPTVIGCKQCEVDIEGRNSSNSKFGVHYLCPYHGAYRHYEDGLWRYKSWCMVWIVILIVPYGLLISASGINVNWATLGIPVVSTSFLCPLFLTLAWSKATAQGVVSGGVIGIFVSIAGMLGMGSTREGGLSKFWINTAHEYSLLVAMGGGFIVSTVITVGVSLCTHKIQSKKEEQREWAKTMNIDNPLNPYRLLFEEELQQINAGPIVTADTMGRIFRKARLVAWIGVAISAAIFVIILPAIALSFPVLSFDQFKGWMRTLQYWVFFTTILVVVVPPVEEGIQIWLRIKKNIQKKKEKKTNDFDITFVSNAIPDNQRM